MRASPGDDAADTTARSTRPARTALVAIAALAMVATSHAPAASASSLCKAALDAGDLHAAREICERAHARSGEDRDLMRVGHVFLGFGDLARAAAIGERLLRGQRPGDGHRLMSQVLFAQGEAERLREDATAADATHQRARAHATAAYDAHQLAGEEIQMAHDAVQLSTISWRLGDFTAARAAAEAAIPLAQRGRDRGVEVAAQRAFADALRRLGDRGLAEKALVQALARATKPCDRAWSHLKLGLLHEEQGERAQAREQLDRARDHLDRAARVGRPCAPTIAPAIELDRARLLITEDPAAADAILVEDLRGHGASVGALFLRGLVAAQRGERRRAAGLLDEAARLEPPDADWPWEILQARAEVAEQRGHVLGDLMAEWFYRRSIALVNALRASAQAQAAFVIASHRAPYDGLIALLARQGRWRDVVAVVLELDAGDMLRATAAAASDERMPVSAGRSAPAPLPAAAVPPVDAVAAAWRGRDLVIVVAPAGRLLRSGGERVVRVRVADGAITGELLGAAADARRDADRLFGDRDDVGAARALGALIVPADARADTLDVLAIDQLGKVPLAALRDPSGALILARRPLARVLSIRPRLDASASTSPAAVVIADPLGDLPGARAEGDLVAAQLGAVAVRSGAGAAPAIRARLDEARAADLLHVAAHVADRGRGRALRLADGDVTASELVAMDLAPRLAVLASCGSGAARDDEGWGSIAAALLASGSAAVVSTDRSVADAASLALIRGFYAQPDWREAPARALARVQVELRARGASTWADFGILHGPPRAVP